LEADSSVKRGRKRILSLYDTKKWRVLRWSVCAILVSKKFILLKPAHQKGEDYATGLFHSSEEKEGKIVVYRAYFVRLLATPKSLHDKLVVELPLLEALRTSEVCTLTVEHVDFEHGDLQVLDSKKHQLYPVPLDPTVAQHLAAYIAEKGLQSGVVLQRQRKAGRKQQVEGGRLTNQAVIQSWWKLCGQAGIPRMSPRMGRAYFAAKWHYVDHKSMYGLMAVLRHNDILATQRYLAKIIDYASVKAEFYRGTKSPFQSRCVNSDKCPMAAEDCYCKSFNPMLEVQK
jgi:integrase